MNDLLLCKPGEIFLKGLNKIGRASCRERV